MDDRRRYERSIGEWANKIDVESIVVGQIHFLHQLEENEKVTALQEEEQQHGQCIDARQHERSFRSAQEAT